MFAVPHSESSPPAIRIDNDTCNDGDLLGAAPDGVAGESATPGMAKALPITHVNGIVGTANIFKRVYLRRADGDVWG